MRTNLKGTCKICGCRVDNRYELCLKHCTNRQARKRAKKLKQPEFRPKTTWVKSKAERQQWWASLSEDEKTAYIEGAQQRKAIKREDKTRATMVKYGQKYQCAECFHRKSGSCIDNLPNGCPHWFSPDSTFQGIAYK